MEIVRDGEVSYNSRKFGEARAWISSHPGRFAELTLARIFYFWFPFPGEYEGYSYRTWLLTVLSLLGVIQLAGNRHPLAGFVVAALLLYPLVFYLVHASIRLRLTMIWIEVLTAGYALALLLERIRPPAPSLAKYTARLRRKHSAYEPAQTETEPRPEGCGLLRHTQTDEKPRLLRGTSILSTVVFQPRRIRALAKAAFRRLRFCLGRPFYGRCRQPQSPPARFNGLTQTIRL